MTNESKREEIRHLCENCSKCFSRITKVGRFHSWMLRDFVSDREVSDALRDFSTYQGREVHFESGSVAFGKFAMYETVLKFKKQNDVLQNEAERKYFRLQLEASIKAYLGIKRFCANHSFDRVVIYSPQYAANRSVAHFFENLGVPVFFMEAGTNVHKRLNTLRAWRWKDFGLTNPLLAISEEELKQFSYSPEDLRWVTQHFLSLLEARSHVVFSKKRAEKFDFFAHFPKARGRKVVVATMSSFDEVFSAYLADLWPEDRAKSKVYSSQVDWIQGLIEYFEKTPDVFLVVRVHPRDFPNKREGLVSDQGKSLLNLFTRLPENVAIDWPEDGLSIYNLLFYADAVTTGWSITALEAGILGIPVVTYDSKLPSYPKTMMYTGASREEYFGNLERALMRGWTFEQVVNSYDWWSLSHNYGSLMISKEFRSFESKDIGVFDRILNRISNHLNFPYMLMKYTNKRFIHREQSQWLRFLVERNLPYLVEVDEVKNRLKGKKNTTLADYKREFELIMNPVSGADGEDSPVIRSMRNFVNG
jgi:hypothetical protein